MENFHEYIPILILVFVVAVCVASAVILAIRSKKSLLKADDKDFIDEAVEKKKRKLNASIGGLSWKEYVTLLVSFPLLLGVVSYLLLDSKPYCIIFIFVGLFVPELLVRVSAKKTKKAFEERYAQALRALASSLRAGMSIEQSIESVGKNPFVDSHIREGFRQIGADIRVGIPLEKAFHKFAEESGSKDALDVASAISMQAKVGGSEARVVGTIAQNINERLMTRKEIKALFADTSILIVAMDFMPWIMLVLLYIGTPQIMAPFFSSFSMFMILVGLMIFTTLGSFVIHHMANTAKGV